MGKNYRNYSKTVKTPRRPFEKERLAYELQLVGEYGLRNKREVWRVRYALAQIRSVARHLMTLEEKDPKRVFDGAALLRRLTRLGLLTEAEQKLDFILGLSVEKFLDRRLQSVILRNSMALSIHHARVMIKQRHIRVGKTLVDIPSFMVRVDSEKHIKHRANSPLSQTGGKPGRVARKHKAANGGDDE